MSADLAEATTDYGDGDGVSSELAGFILCLSRRAAERGAGVDGVMRRLIEDALKDWAGLESENDLSGL